MLERALVALARGPSKAGEVGVATARSVCFLREASEFVFCTAAPLPLGHLPHQLFAEVSAGSKFLPCKISA